MNERIEELAEQVGWRDGNILMYEEDMEKFAELIVRECVKLQHRNVIVGSGVSAYNMGRRDLAEDILKHFGVES
jgi:hypothetical protein